MKRIILMLATTLLLCSCASNPPAAEQAGFDLGFTVPDVGKELDTAKNMLDGRNPDAAIATVDKVIARFEQATANVDKVFYSARTREELIAYLGMSMDRPSPRDAIGLGPEWMMALHFKGYALVEKGDIDGARAALEQARELAPLNSQVLSELAHTYQARKEWQQSLALFEEAEKASKWSPQADMVIERGRALRGIGFSLIELGRLDEAEAKFKECLAINPDDEYARSELGYIASLRGKSD